MRTGVTRKLASALCAVTLSLVGAASASAVPPEPDYFFSGMSGGFEGPCGLAMDSVGYLYVSDYYRNAINVYSIGNDPKKALFITQVPKVDPLDGPCGLSLDAAGSLYVNNYHRNVQKFVPSIFPPEPFKASPPTPSTQYASAGIYDSSTPTGVAVDPATGRIYVNARTYVAVYGPSGAPVLNGEGEPVRIGLGDLGDAYGLAISSFPETNGSLYVADAAANKVKVFDPGAVNPEKPIKTIPGPGSGFSSLVDSALAVDRVSGEIYVVDNLEPQYNERPEAAVYVYSSKGSYLGRLMHNIVDALPPGLVVDNTKREGAQGDVYVTSGNAEGAFVIKYPPGSVTDFVAPPPNLTGVGGLSSSAGRVGGGPASGQQASIEPTATASTIAQKGTLRVKVDGKLSPRRLPRKSAAPIAVSVGGRVTTTDESAPPQLQSLRIELNRHGRLDYTGLPTCPYHRIQPASTSRALSACRSALVGRGSFTADITLAGQEPYPAKGRLLAFNGVRKGKPVVFAQIYSPHPFAASFVIVFAIEKLRGGTYGTALNARLPASLGTWGNVTGIQLTLSRRYRHAGERHSYLSAPCPAPQGFSVAPFPLARATFGFEGGKRLSSTLSRSCRVRG